MKTLIKFLNGPFVNFLVIIFVVYMFGTNPKFLHVYKIIAPFAAVCIWWLNWEYIKKYKSGLGLGISLVLFMLDVITWPIALIQSSSIILEEEEKSV